MAYTNYLEQVNNSVSNMVQVDYMNMLNQFENWEDYTFITHLDENSDIDEIDVYKFFIVDIHEENEETNKLGIFFSSLLSAYILPVTDFGTPWESVEAVDLSNRLQ